MPKAQIAALDPRHGGRLRRGAWSLCIGAGTSAGLLPKWDDLTRRVLSTAIGKVLPQDDFADIRQRTGWGFDVWLQAALNAWNAAGGTDDTFMEVLERELYSDLLTTAKAAGVADEVLVGLTSIGMLTKERLQSLVSFVERAYPQSSTLALARHLVTASRNRRGPEAVITLNFDTLLEGLIRSYQIHWHARDTGRWEFPPELYSRVTGPDVSWGERTPIIHLHGAITPPIARKVTARMRDSRNSVIAQEGSYAALAGSTFNWAQTTFLHYAQRDNLVFFGQSLSDPNIRRWLAWAQGLRVRHRAILAGTEVAILPHIWLRPRPTTVAEQDLIVAGVGHLGIQVGWLDNWTDIDVALENLAGAAT